MEGLAALNPTLITLANNHILDQGRWGLECTESLLNLKNIPYIGAGSSLAEASRPFVLKTKEGNIGFYACAEHEFTIAYKCNPGANPFDPLESLDHINELKNITDYVIVLYHGGKEHYRYPSPYLQRVCRKMVEKGANMVITQHSHCVGSYEKYCNGTIVYGQGNFIFNNQSNEYWDTSILVEVNIENKNVIFIPLQRTKDGTSLATGLEGKIILDEFENRSREILEKGFIERNYNDFARKSKNQYLLSFADYNRWQRALNRFIFNGKLIEKKYTPQKLIKIRNFIECESHRELFIESLKEE